MIRVLRWANANRVRFRRWRKDGWEYKRPPKNQYAEIVADGILSHEHPDLYWRFLMGQPAQYEGWEKKALLERNAQLVTIMRRRGVGTALWE
jgi:hypothetical protein